MLFTTLGLWDRAAADYDRRLSLGVRSGSQILYEHALLKFYLGDDAGYREVCREMLQQHGRAGGNDLYRLIRACALSPEPAADSADLVRRAENLIASYYSPWNLAAAGLAHLRADHFELAVERLRDGIERGTNSPEGVHRIAYAPLAIALHRLGKAAEAQDALRQAEQALDGWTNEMAEGPVGTMPIDWHAWMECSSLCREAKQAVTGSAPPPDPRLQAVHDRALAIVMYGDQFTFMQAARSHVERQEWDLAAAQFGKVLDQLPPGFRASSQAMRMCVEMVQQPEVFDRLVAQRPGDTRLWYARGRVFASGRDWERAAADYTEAIGRLDEKAPPIARASRRLELSAIRLLAGDEAACRELCAAVVAEQAAFNEPFTAQMASRTCTLMRDAVDDASIAVRLAQLAVDADPSVAWYQWALGAALYRAGEDERAVQVLETSLDVHPAWVGRGQNYIVLAMACQRLGRHDAARDWLAQAKSWLDETNQRKDANQYGFATSDYLSDWLAALVLLPEAERVIDESSSP
jgi:tetratricopeptide (TPR) repeat protein